MRKTVRNIAVLSAAAALLCTFPAAAEGPVKAKIEAAKEKRAEAREKTKEAIKKTVAGADDAKEAREKAKEARKEARGSVGDAKEAVKEQWKKMRETRKERREERRTEIKEKWGEDALKRPAVRAELRMHSRRVARLNRIRSLAKAEGKDAVVERVDKILAKENSRHDKHMETLKTQTGGAK